MTDLNTIHAALLERGKAQGYLTFDDFLFFVPDAEENLELVEELMEVIAEAGIELLKEAPASVEQKSVVDPVMPVASDELDMELIEDDLAVAMLDPDEPTEADLL